MELIKEPLSVERGGAAEWALHFGSDITVSRDPRAIEETFNNVQSVYLREGKMNGSKMSWPPRYYFNPRELVPSILLPSRKLFTLSSVYSEE